jgi:hypothetical protein
MCIPILKFPVTFLYSIFKQIKENILMFLNAGSKMTVSEMFIIKYQKWVQDDPLSHSFVNWPELMKT